jgi:hypothetical protein
MALDMNQDIEADVSRHFVPYSTQINKTLVESAFKASSSQIDVPASVWPEVWLYADKIACQGN